MITEGAVPNLRTPLLRPYVALSRYPLQPRLVRQIPEPFARAHRVIPLERQDDELVVAMANPDERGVLRDLRSLTASTIRPVPTGEADIDVALNRVYAPHEPPADWAFAIQSLAHTGFLTETQARTIAQELDRSQPPDPDRFPLAGVLTEEDLIEALGMALYLPHLRLKAWAPFPPFVRLIPEQLARRWQLVALFPIGTEMVLASPTLPPENALREVEQLTGLPPYVVLCTPSEARQALENSYLPQAEDLPRPTKSLWQELLEHRSVDRGQIARASTIAVNTGEPVEKVLLRLGLIDEYDLLEARAHQLGIQPVRLSHATVDPSLASGFPEPLARRLGCLPLAMSKGRLQVATAETVNQDALKLLERLYGCPVEAHLCGQAELEENIGRLYATGSTSHAAPQEETYLLRGGRMTARQIERGLQRQRRTHQPLANCLRDLDLLDEAGLIELQALQLRIPWVTASRYAPTSETINLLSKELASQYRLLPLHREGRILTAATPDPQSVRTLEQAIGTHGLIPRVVVTSEEAVQLAIERLYDSDLSRLSAPLREFAESMVVSGVISREQLLQIWQHQLRSELPFDIAITDLGFLSEQQLADAMAARLHLTRTDLRYHSVPVEVIDALGNRRQGLRWVEPVEPEVARLLPEEVANRCVAVPVRREGNTIAVAFANPLDGAPEQVEEALGRPISILVATRSEVLEALRRVHGRQTLGDLLVQKDLINRQQLEKGLATHRQTGVRLEKALLSLGYITQEQLVDVLSEQLQVPHYSLAEVEIDEEAARSVPESLTRERGVLPLARVGNRVVLAMVNPLDSETIAQVEGITGCRVDPVITTEEDLEEALERIYRSEYLWRSANDLVYRYPDDSAMRVLTRRQKAGLLAFLGLSLLLVAVNPLAYFTWAIALSTAFYLAFSTYKFYLIYKAISHTLEVDVTPEEIMALDERDLPIYTVLVPLYREAEVLPTLIRAIGNLDYPKAKLDVKLLLEEDDRETIEAALRHDLPAHFKVVVVPHSLPKGKPKACNYGLIHAQGEYVVIYDAEDIPDRDQLKRVVAAFRKADPRVQCIQAKLNYYNRDQNLLTRWFTTEYSMWFDLFIPGLDASNSPIPLGGTSNHFRTAQLRELGGWDPYNVTEDADLGVRLFKAGGKTAVVDSTTYEEANSELYNWIRQRSRWVKGYIQTYLVHMRHPLKLMRDIGPYQFFSFNMVVGGTFFGFLMNPVFWGLTAIWYLTRWDVIQLLYPAPVFYLGAIGLYIGNFAFMYTNVAGCMRRGYYDMVKYALISPLYWALMSIGAWKGFIQLFYRPSYWEKTKHGLYQGEIKTTPAASLGDLL